MKNIGTKIDNFFFKEARVTPLASLRIGISAVLILQFLWLWPLLSELYGKFGIMQGTITDYFGPGLPNMGTMLRILEAFGVNERAAIGGFGVFYLFCVGALLLGFYTRIVSVVVWFTHLIWSQGHTTSYGLDTYANIFLFYLMWVPCGNEYSFDRVFRKVQNAPSATARLGIRVMQLHLCFSYFASGIEKSLGPQWQHGDVIWRALMLPVYMQMDMNWLSSFPWIPKILSWGTLIVEVGYPFLIFPRRTRPIWVVLVVSLHIGISIFLGLHLFGLIMAVLTGALFGMSAEPRKNALSSTFVCKPAL